MKEVLSLPNQYKRIKIDNSWSFDKLTKKETNYASHGYHNYPAKFIPQIVSKILATYSVPGQVVLDCFGGCGTTLVEAKLNNRNSVILDVNKIALLISKAKKNAINPIILEEYNKNLLNKLNRVRIKKDHYEKAHPRLRYWFKRKQYNKLMEIYLLIKNIDNPKLKNFYGCCFSNILKKCSIWYSKSIKPMKDIEKQDYDPVESFLKHLNYMTVQNSDYYNLIKGRDNKETWSKILERDARKTGLKSDSIDLVITSPPYAVSYEYADLHQLSLLWFNFTRDINETKKKFIGSSSNIDYSRSNNSPLSRKIINNLLKQDRRLAGQISQYYSDMADVFSEIYRILKKRKVACILIGNTEYKGIKIRNMEVSSELLKKVGFRIEKIIKRKLSSKIFTPYRDKAGKFTQKNKKSKKVYQYEYIIITRKP